MEAYSRFVGKGRYKLVVLPGTGMWEKVGKNSREIGNT